MGVGVKRRLVMRGCEAQILADANERVARLHRVCPASHHSYDDRCAHHLHKPIDSIATAPSLQ